MADAYQIRFPVSTSAYNVIKALTISALHVTCAFCLHGSLSPSDGKLVTLVMDAWAAGALPSGLVVKSIHWLYRACPSGSSKSAITSFTWYSGTVCSQSRDLLTLASVNSVIFNGSHATKKGAYDYTRALTSVHDRQRCLPRDLGQKMNALQINLVTRAFEYIRSLMIIFNPLRRLLISISIA